jgi:hypothetical protein
MAAVSDRNAHSTPTPDSEDAMAAFETFTQ